MLQYHYTIEPRLNAAYVSYLFCYTIVDGPRSVSIFPRGQRLAHGMEIECTANGNPQPTFYWTTSLLDDGTSRTFTGTKLTVDVCNLTSWSQRSEKENKSGTMRLMLTCHAQNTVRGQTRTSSAQKVYDLALLKNMDEVCGKFVIIIIITERKDLGGVMSKDCKDTLQTLKTALCLTSFTVTLCGLQVYISLSH